MLDDHILFKDEKLETWIYFKGDKLMIAIDRKDLWDKIWKCPINVQMPKTEKELDMLIKKIKWLRTDDGWDASQHYEFDLWMTSYK